MFLLYLFVDDFVLPSWMEFIGRTIQLLLSSSALAAFLALDLNSGHNKCSSDNGVIYSLVALILVSISSII